MINLAVPPQFKLLPNGAFHSQKLAQDPVLFAQEKDRRKRSIVTHSSCLPTQEDRASEKYQ
jgi:hypothetical protein